MNGQNDEFQTEINCHKVFTACAATGDQPTVYKESQLVPSIKIESYILATFLNTIFRGNHAINRIKGNNNLNWLETHAIAGRMNASYISEALYKLIKGSNKLSQRSNVSHCLTPL